MINFTEILQFILLKRYLRRKKYCSKECNRTTGVCDICEYYNYNGEDLIEDGKVYKGAIYTGDGWCDLKNDWREPWNSCEEFNCFIHKKKE